MLAMNVFERTEYAIKKKKTHLTAGANRCGYISVFEVSFVKM